MTADIAKLGPMLRTWRGRLSPAAAGLPAGRGRRVSGLRRETLPSSPGSRSITSSASSRDGPRPRRRRWPRRWPVPCSSPTPSGTISTGWPGLPPGPRGDLRPHPARPEPHAEPARRRRGGRVRRGLAADLVEPRLGGVAWRPVVDSAGAAQLRSRHLPGRRGRPAPLALAGDLAQPAGGRGLRRVRPAPRHGALPGQRPPGQPDPATSRRATRASPSCGLPARSARTGKTTRSSSTRR